MVGDPSPTNFYVFNGDYVDRGAWGLETLLLIGAWRLANPHAVTMLRGNHETALCSMVYGFKGELVAKLGRGKWKVRRRVWALHCRDWFSLALSLQQHVPNSPHLGPSGSRTCTASASTSSRRSPWLRSWPLRPWFSTVDFFGRG